MGLPQEQTVAELHNLIALFVARRVPDAYRAQDIVQETMSRVLPVMDRVEASALAPYAVTVAKNLLISESKDQQRERLALLRSAGRQELDDFVGLDLESSERSEALRKALNKLPDEEALLLTSHHFEEMSIKGLAADGRTSPGAVAVRLARIRAKVRVDYIVEYRKVRLSESECRPVLIALSAGDVRRQTALRAGHHLMNCKTCGQLAPLLLERQRGFALAIPFVYLVGQGRRAANQVVNHPLLTAGTALAAGTCLVGATTILQPQTTRPVAATRSVAPGASIGSTTVASNPCDNVLSIGGRTPAVGAISVPASDGDQVVANGATVYSALVHSGFWIGCGGYRLRVQVTGADTHAWGPPGSHVGFVGLAQRHQRGYGASIGFIDSLARAQIDDAGYHAEVGADSVHSQ